MAGYTTAGLNAQVNGLASAGAYISGHTADPGSGGASEIAGGSPAYARQQTTWAAASGGSRVGSQISANVPAGTTIRYWGIWSAVSGGTFLGGFPVSTEETFGAAGTWQHTPTITNTNPS